MLLITVVEHLKKYSTPLCHVAGQPFKKNGVIIRGSTHPTVLYDSNT